MRKLRLPTMRIGQLSSMSEPPSWSMTAATREGRGSGEGGDRGAPAQGPPLMAGSTAADTFEEAAEPDHPLNLLHPRRSEAAALIDLANRIRRLAPSRTDPESYFIEKSEIEHALRRLARSGPGGS